MMHCINGKSKNPSLPKNQCQINHKFNFKATKLNHCLVTKNLTQVKINYHTMTTTKTDENKIKFKMFCLGTSPLSKLREKELLYVALNLWVIQ